MSDRGRFNRPRGFRGNSFSSTRGRGRGYKSYTPPAYRSSPEPEPVPLDLGKVIETVSKYDLNPTTSTPTVIRNAEAVASFNWLGGVDNRSIAIPGGPPRWAPPKDNPRLSEDSGTYYRDINAAHLPHSPLHATALAILANPAIPTASIDLVACASTLRSLLLFARGERKTFRIMVEAVDNTVFFVRRESSPREVIPNVRGYGHSMPEAYTMWNAGVTESVSNQRIVRYVFAGLDCLVRYEPDGYFPDELGEADPASSTQASDSTTSVAGNELDAAMANVNVSLKLPAQTDSDLQVKEAGTHIPQRATFELKTRSWKRQEEDFFPEFAARLWITQTPYFIVAFHRSGTFNDIRIRDVRSDIAAWESDNQDDIKRFAGLVEWIVRRARNEPDGMLELWRHESAELEVRMPGGDFQGALPIDVEDRWKGGEEGGVVLGAADQEETHDD